MSGELPDLPDPGASDDRTCPSCGSGDYWLTEVEKECKACGTTWFSAWSLAHNDDPSDGSGQGQP